MRTRIVAFLLCLATFAGFGCSEDPMVVSQRDAASFADPSYYTICWPPPTWQASVMKMDPHSGQGTIVVALDVAPSPPGWSGDYPGFATPYGIAFDIDGTAYSIHNWFDGVQAECYSQLIRMDLQTGAVEPIGPVHNMNFAGPEFDACGTLYATGFTVGPPEGGDPIVWGDSNLYRFDKHTGDKTLIGDTGHTQWMDLEFDAEGRLWGTFGNDLYTIDTKMGASTLMTHIYGVEDNRIPGVCEEDWEYMEVMSLAFDHRGVLWATAMKGFSWCDVGGLAAPVMTIDLDTGVASLVGSTRQDGQSHGGDIPPVRVTVCHRTGQGYMPLEISIAALHAHLAHGDVLPGGIEGFDCDCQGTE